MQVNSNLVEIHIFREMKGVLEFLLLKRSPWKYYPNIWQMVSGKIKRNEKAYECAVREMFEETGLTPEKIWVVPNVSSFYSADTDTITVVPVFAARVGFECEIQLSEEHVAYKWVLLSEAMQILAWDGQRRSAHIIEDYFTNHKSFWALSEVTL